MGKVADYYGIDNEFGLGAKRSKRSDRIWKTKDGRLMLIVDMRNGHLINTIRYLQRRAYTIHERWCSIMAAEMSCLRGEAAMDCAVGELDRYLDMDPLEFLSYHYEPYKWLVSEAYKRRIFDPVFGTEQLTLDEWLDYGFLFTVSKRLSSVAKCKPGEDFWTDFEDGSYINTPMDMGEWSVEVLSDGTAVTVCND